jgi:hypothetical protein
MYFWNNGSSTVSQSSCSSPAHIKTTGDSPAHTGGVLDYVDNGSTPKPGYTPYTYPHPLSASTPAPGLVPIPMPPLNLKITN